MSLERRCRICLEESDSEDNPFLSPCNCTGTAAFVHRLCITRWRRVNRGNPNSRRCRECLAPYDLTSPERPEYPVVGPIFMESLKFHIFFIICGTIVSSMLLYLGDYLHNRKQFFVLEIVSIGSYIPTTAQEFLHSNLVVGAVLYICVLASLVRLFFCILLWTHSIFFVRHKTEYYRSLGAPIAFLTVTSPEVFYLWHMALPSGDFPMWLVTSVVASVLNLVAAVGVLKLHVSVLEKINGCNMPRIVDSTN